MIISTLFGFFSTIAIVLTRIVSLPLMPLQVTQNISDILDLLFSNFTMINILCHVSFLNLIFSLILSIWLFRNILNVWRFFSTRGHTK